MGVLGLRKFIEAAACTKFLSQPIPGDDDDNDDNDNNDNNNGTEDHHRTASLAGRVGNGPKEPCHSSAGASSAEAAAPCVDHVLVDMNCIIHSCFRRDASMTKRDLIHAVLARLRALLTRIVIPRVSLTICIDGPAPYAKLQTQRLRRRKVALLDAGGSQQLTALAITPGSLFLVELENALAAQFKLRAGRGFLPYFVPVFLHGSTVVGEGEAKIARALAFLATASRDALPQREQYNPNDTVAVIGNDIDLTLTCLGATQYHNFFVIGPSSLHVISVADILYRWLRSSAGEFRLTAHELASVRVDFVFLFMLNGGDHYVGAGEIAHTLWPRYRTVRGTAMHRTLVAPDLLSVDTEFLSEVLQADAYTGDADVGTGVELLRAALWALYTTVTGVCPDYAFVPSVSVSGEVGAGGPHLNHLRAAVAAIRRNRRTSSTYSNRHHNRHGRAAGSRRDDNNRNTHPSNGARTTGIDISLLDGSAPLTPLETLVALTPTESMLPSSIACALRSDRRGERIAQELSANTHDALRIAAAARDAVAAAGPQLTLSEQCLRDFTDPVRLNVIQKPRRLSRHEQHRMLATQGRIVRDEPIPLVTRIEMPQGVRYVNVPYPVHVRDLRFPNALEQQQQQQQQQQEQQPAVPRVTHSPSFHLSDPHKDSQRDPQRDSRRDPRRDVRKVPAHPALLHDAPSAAQRVRCALEEASALRQPDGRDRKTLRRLKKRLHAHQLQGGKEVREAEAQGEAKRYELRRDDTAFLAELKEFLGEDADESEKDKCCKKSKKGSGGGCMEDILRDDTPTRPKREKQKGKMGKTPQNGGGEVSGRGKKRAREESTDPSLSWKAKKRPHAETNEKAKRNQKGHVSGDAVRKNVKRADIMQVHGRRQ